MQPKYPNIEVEITDRDFHAMVGKVSAALEENGVELSEVAEFQADAVLAGSDEDKLIDLIQRWVAINYISPKYPNIEVEITDRDFHAMVGKVSAALEENGVELSEVAEFQADAVLAGSNENKLINLIQRWVEISNK